MDKLFEKVEADLIFLDINIYKLKYNKDEVFNALEKREIREREFILKMFFGGV
jgi:hypothetical protein